MAISPESHPVAINGADLDAFALEGMATTDPIHRKFIPTFTAKSRSNKVEWAEYGNFGLLAKKRPNQGVLFSEPREGYVQNKYYEVFALGVMFARETIEDDRVGFVASVLKRLGQAGPRTQEFLAAQILNSADATTYHSVNGGSALASATHRLVPGGPANYSTLLTPAAFSSISLEAALSSFDSRTDDRGNPLDEDAEYLVYDPVLKWKVCEVLQSPGDPESDRRAVNAVGTLTNLKPIAWKYLTRTGAWFLLSKQNQHGIRFVLRAGLATQNQGDLNTTSMIYVVRGRWTFIVMHPRGFRANFAGA